MWSLSGFVESAVTAETATDRADRVACQAYEAKEKESSSGAGEPSHDYSLKGSICLQLKGVRRSPSCD